MFSEKYFEELNNYADYELVGLSIHEIGATKVCDFLVLECMISFRMSSS